MAQISAEQMQQLVVELAQKSSVGKFVRQVEVERQRDDEADGTIRIVIKMKNLQNAELFDLQQLLTAVEDSLSSKDDRYPSVRFAEAA